MAKNSMVLFLSFLAITVQYILYIFYGAQECFPYINNIAYSDDVGTNLIQVMLAFFPIPLYSFICYGYVRNNIVRDSYMKIIRSYSRIRIWIRNKVRLICAIGCIALFQIGIYVLLDCNTQYSVSIVWKYLGAIICYYVFLIMLLSFQMLLELFANADIALVIINIFCLVSILAGNFLLKHRLKDMLYILFPNLMFSNRNAIMDGNINYFYIFGYVIFISITINLVSIIKYKRMDII